jgi:hypothetical protein
LSVAPGLEGGRLRVEFQPGSTAELRALVAKLNDATLLSSMGAIFELLSGDSGKEQN